MSVAVFGDNDNEREENDVDRPEKETNEKEAIEYPVKKLYSATLVLLHMHSFSDGQSFIFI